MGALRPGNILSLTTIVKNMNASPNTIANVAPMKATSYLCLILSQKPIFAAESIYFYIKIASDHDV